MGVSQIIIQLLIQNAAAASPEHGLATTSPRLQLACTRKGVLPIEALAIDAGIGYVSPPQLLQSQTSVLTVPAGFLMPVHKHCGLQQQRRP